MRIVNLARQQFHRESRRDPLSETFFEEYGRTFYDGGEDLETAPPLADAETTEANIGRLAECIRLLTPRLPVDTVDAIVFFVGPGRGDAHGILINDRPCVFFDMTLMNEVMASDCHALQTHVAHELVHGCHYAVQPRFYPGNYRTLQERFYYRTWAEGVATFMSETLAGTTACTAASLGFMSESEFQAWVHLCIERKPDITAALTACFDGGHPPEALWRRLFFLPDRGPDAMTRGRFGYWYGRDLAQAAAGAGSLLEVSPEAVIKLGSQYFNQ